MFTRLAILLLAVLIAVPALAQGGPGPAPKKLDGPRREGVETHYIWQGNDFIRAIAIKPDDIPSYQQSCECQVSSRVPTVAERRAMVNRDRIAKGKPAIEPQAPERLVRATRQTPGDRSTPIVAVGPPAFLCGGDPDFPGNANPAPCDDGAGPLGDNEFYIPAKPDGTPYPSAERAKDKCLAQGSEAECRTPEETQAIIDDLETRLDALENQ